MSGGSRVSIPSSDRKTIQNIKEITGNHSDDEIYAMLKECSMDPNETAQKLLLQDTFHEVKRKRDRRKENLNNREQADARWKVQGWGGRGGRGNYSSRSTSNDTGATKNASEVKENGTNQAPNKGSTTTPVLRDTEDISVSITSNSVSGMVNGPAKPACIKSSHGTGLQVTGTNVTSNQETHTARTSRTELAPPINANAKVGISGAMATVKCQPGSQQAEFELNQPGIKNIVCNDVSGTELSSLHINTSSSYRHEEFPNKCQGYELNHISEATQVVSASSIAGSSGSRPSSNYSNRSQQLIGPKKAGPSKEWKPKSTNPNLVQLSGTVAQLPTDASSKNSEGTSSQLQRSLEELQFSDGPHVIFPNHIQVQEAERIGLSFGSFGTSFGLVSSFSSTSDSDKISTSPELSHSSQRLEVNTEEPSSSIQNDSGISQEEGCIDHPQSPTTMPEMSSGETGSGCSVSAGKENDQSKQDTVLAANGTQESVVETVPTISTFEMLPVLGSQFVSIDSSQPQGRDSSRLPGVVVQQPFDPTYYSHVYRPNADGDGRVSPFLSQNGQSSQESGNSLVQPISGSAPLLTQATGAMQSSIAIAQQPIPVFRQPAGVHISHYPPNCIPYNPYFSPFYVPPPALHHFLSNAVFPQQHATGSIYPPPMAAAATPVKYSISHYKPGSVNGNSNHVSGPTGYGPYTTGTTGYSPIPAVNTANTTSNEDINTSQYKESNGYLKGQQTEGSTVWVPAPSREVPGLQANSFYNLPQGQHVTFAPTQAGHGTFAGIYHNNQTLAAATVHPLLQSQSVSGPVEMAGPPVGIYQQPQRAAINWASSY